MTAPRPARQTQAERRSLSERALLDAAAQVVAETGVDRGSLAEIGQRAGVSRGLANHHFGSKDALVARLAERAQTFTTDAVARAVADAGEPSGLEQLEITLRAYLGLFADPNDYERALIVLWGETFPTTSPARALAAADEVTASGWAAGVRRGMADGSYRTDLDPDVTGELLLSMTRGLAALLMSGRVEPQAAIDHAVALLVRAFAAPGS